MHFVGGYWLVFAILLIALCIAYLIKIGLFAFFAFSLYRSLRRVDQKSSAKNVAIFLFFLLGTLIIAYVLLVEIHPIFLDLPARAYSPLCGFHESFIYTFTYYNMMGGDSSFDRYSECMKQTGLFQNDMAACNEIDVYLRKTCIETAAAGGATDCESLELERDKTDCFFALIDNADSPEDCEGIPHYGFVHPDSCFFKVARDTKDYSVCSRIIDVDTRNNCPYATARQSTEAADCENAGSVEVRDFCFFNLANNANDSHFCERIEDEDSKNSCFFSLSRYAGEECGISRITGHDMEGLKALQFDCLDNIIYSEGGTVDCAEFRDRDMIAFCEGMKAAFGTCSNEFEFTTYKINCIAAEARNYSLCSLAVYPARGYTCDSESCSDEAVMKDCRIFVATKYADIRECENGDEDFVYACLFSVLKKEAFGCNVEWYNSELLCEGSEEKNVSYLCDQLNSAQNRGLCLNISEQLVPACSQYIKCYPCVAYSMDECRSRCLPVIEGHECETNLCALWDNQWIFYREEECNYSMLNGG